MLKLLLYPLSFFYGIGVYFRNRMYDLNMYKSVEFDIPVISVGNITVGGTGKTPHTEYLIDLLKDEFKLAVLSRGYRRKTKGFREITIGSTARDSGDEPLQIKNKHPEVGVYVDEKRVHGIEEILRLNDEKPPEIILLDDAFQHRKVTPTINILLVDYTRPISEDMLLPAGRLREGKIQMKRANMIIFTKCPEEIKPITRRLTMKDIWLRPYQNLYFTKMEYQPLKPVFKESTTFSQPFEISKHTVLLLTGIANPDPLQKYLLPRCGKIVDAVYPDHHDFKDTDIKQIEEKFNAITSENKLIITTEKDATRLMDFEDLPAILKENLYYIPIKIKFLDSEGKSFDKKILDYVRENKSNSELYKRKNIRLH